jgi:hypothetical protein
MKPSRKAFEELMASVLAPPLMTEPSDLVCIEYQEGEPVQHKCAVCGGPVMVRGCIVSQYCTEHQQNRE